MQKPPSAHSVSQAQALREQVFEDASHTKDEGHSFVASPVQGMGEQTKSVGEQAYPSSQGRLSLQAWNRHSLDAEQYVYSGHGAFAHERARHRPEGTSHSKRGPHASLVAQATPHAAYVPKDCGWHRYGGELPKDAQSTSASQRNSIGGSPAHDVSSPGA